MTSQDVIHSFFVPAFRMKKDVLPGRYTETLVPGHARPASSTCSAPNICGTDHSAMRGRIVVMRQDDYARWLARAAGGRRPGP